jgi:hypothetical protein
VGVNEHAGFSCAVPQLVWGAYPGNTPEDIGSGIGFVNNTLMLPNPEQGVLRAAFRAPVKPLLTATHRTLAPALNAYTDWIASGDNPLRLPAIMLHAVRG